ncbi:MAG TPA: 7TM diverse intracellular signaling domain-containing protein, partial [Ramlibacter sp.]
MRSRAVLARLLLVFLLGWVPAAGFAHDPGEVARAGVLDLTLPGATSSIHELRGDWGFAWQRFLDPADNSPPVATAPVPGSWNDVIADGKPPGPDGYGTYTLQVRCPAGQQVALAMPAQRTAMRLYVNGRLAMTQGQPGRTAAEARPAIGQRAVLTDTFACPLRITVHLSSYDHRAGGFVRAPISGPLEVLAPDFKQRLALDTILLGAYLVLSITPAFFFLARRKDVTPLLFGLFCLAQTVYSDMTGERLLLQLGVGPQAPWELYLRLEYLAWYLSMALFLLLADALFPRALRAGIVRALVAACAAAALVVALTPARTYSHSVFFGQALGVGIGIYVLVCIGRAARQGRRDAGVLLVGMGFLFAVLVVNLLEFYTGLALRSLTAVGLLAFVLSPALVLLRRLARALTTEEQRSTEQREKADLLVRTTQAGILDMDLARGLVRYSARLLEILGHPPDEDTTGWPEFFERIHPHERAMVRETFQRQLQDRSVLGGEQRHQPEEYRLLRQDGSAVWVHAEAISLRAADGGTLRYICSILDITDHRAVAEGLKRQNAALAENARLREDVERMSRHDLKTPLNSIIGVTRLLREDAGIQPEHRELLAITERAGYRMLEMVNLSLDLSRMELGTYDFTPQAVNLVDVVARVLLDVQGTAEAARVQLGLDQAFSKPVYARAEELLCYSILANLVKNAVEATPAHGTVAIGIERGDPVRVWVHNASQVAPEVASRFFDKYATAGKPGGTGLGTYSARLMARVQEGELDMRTGADGTWVTLTLRALGAEQLPPPLLALPPGATAAAPSAGVAGADFPPRRVRVADDDEYNRLLLLRYLP